MTSPPAPPTASALVKIPSVHEPRTDRQSLFAYLLSLPDDMPVMVLTPMSTHELRVVTDYCHGMPTEHPGRAGSYRQLARMVSYSTQVFDDDAPPPFRPARPSLRGGPHVNDAGVPHCIRPDCAATVDDGLWLVPGLAKPLCAEHLRHEGRIPFDYFPELADEALELADEIDSAIEQSEAEAPGLLDDDLGILLGDDDDPDDLGVLEVRQVLDAEGNVAKCAECGNAMLESAYVMRSNGDDAPSYWHDFCDPQRPADNDELPEPPDIEPFVPGCPAELADQACIRLAGHDGRHETTDGRVWGLPLPALMVQRPTVPLNDCPRARCHLRVELHHDAVKLDGLWWHAECVGYDREERAKDGAVARCPSATETLGQPGPRGTVPRRERLPCELPHGHPLPHRGTLGGASYSWGRDAEAPGSPPFDIVSDAPGVELKTTVELGPPPAETEESSDAGS